MTKCTIKVKRNRKINTSSIRVSSQNCIVRIIVFKPHPPAKLERVSHIKGVDGHVIRTVGRYLATAHVATHGNIEQDGEVPHWPCARRDAALHDRLPVDVPHHSALSRLTAGLIPSKVVADGTLRHARYGRDQDSVLISLMVMAEVKTCVILAVAVPRLGDVNLAVLGPREGLLRQKPKGWPDAWSTGELDDAG